MRVCGRDPSTWRMERRLERADLETEPDATKGQARAAPLRHMDDLTHAEEMKTPAMPLHGPAIGNVGMGAACRLPVALTLAAAYLQIAAGVDICVSG